MKNIVRNVALGIAAGIAAAIQFYLITVFFAVLWFGYNFFFTNEAICFWLLILPSPTGLFGSAVNKWPVIAKFIVKFIAATVVFITAIAVSYYLFKI